MFYKPVHVSLARFAARSGVIAGAAALAAATAGSLAVPAANAASTPLQVSLGTQVPGDGSSAAWSPDGLQIDLTLGQPSSATGAYATITPASTAVTPSTPEPSFTTDSYSAGSPRWVIELSNGASLWGYPPNSQLNGTDFAWAVNNGNTYTTWANALASAGVTANTTVTATSVEIVADGDQANGTTDQIGSVSYGGQSVGAGTVTLGTEANQQATEGTHFTLNDAATTTSSDPNLTYSASGLPSGLSIDPSTGTISGTPAEAGQFAVTVHAKDVYGDGSSYQHFVLDVNAVTYTAGYNGGEGVIRNAYSGKYLNVMASTYATGSKIAQWDSTGASHEKFQIVTLTGSDGSKAGYLEAIAPNGTKWFVVANGTGQLTLGGQAPAYLTDAAGEGTAIASSSEDMLKSGPYYTFPNDGGKVADDSGWSLKNGASVISYAKNNGQNQQWSLP